MALLNPLFLLGLAALAVPIIVHLVRRTRATRVEFPSLMFVRQVPQRTIRRRMLHNLLLLLLRALAFLLLALAFMRPYFGDQKADAEQGARANIYLLDTSFSMRYGSMRYGTRFEQAKARIKTLLSELRANERAALVTFGNRYEVISRFTDDKVKLNTLLDSLQPGWQSTDYTQAIRGAAELFKEAGKLERRIVLLSDFQKSGRNEAATPFRLDKSIRLVPVDVSEADAVNLAITEVSAQPLIYQPKYTDKLTARVTNFSDEAKTGVRVEFNLNDRLAEKREISVPARESTTVEFTGFNLTEGINRCYLQIEGDSFPVDNRFHFTLRRAEPLKALVIDTATRGRSESFYLRNALTTGENLPFTVDIKTAGAVNPGELATRRVVLLNDAAISAGLGNGLVKFVEAGGGLVVALGPHTDASGLQTALGVLLPAKLGTAVNLRGNYVALSDIKTDHPVFEVFRQSGRLASARVSAYWKTTPSDGATVLARYEDGSAALVEKSYGAGKVLLLTTTFDASWNDLPLSPLYLPLVRQLTRHLGEREERAWQTVGNTFAVAPDAAKQPPAIDTPNGERLTERNQSATGDLLITAREPGFYRLRYPDATAFTAVNLDAQESDLAKLEISEFMASLTGAETTASGDPIAPTGADKEALEAKQRVWWWLIILALGLFVLEAVLARRTKVARVIG